jgi:hypothetical protein
LISNRETIYLAGAALILLTSKITTISAIANTNIPGIPTSSAKPVLGRAVEVGMMVCVEAAICVKAAPTVAVAGSGVMVAVAVAAAMTGVLVGGIVGVTAAVWISA